MNETYEQAVARTGRKWPYRTAEWPCPACGKAECDLDINLVWNNGHVFIYQHCAEGTRRPEEG